MKAFPVIEKIYEQDGQYHTIYSEGMDLRDYFAAKAMDKIVWGLDNKNECAKFVYEISDAMMKAREQA